MCLPSQVTVSAVSGWRAAWSFPKVCQLLFSASGDKHQRTHKVKNGTDTKGGGVSPRSHSVIFPGRHVLGIVLYTVKSRCLLFPNLEDENLR